MTELDWETIADSAENDCVCSEVGCWWKARGGGDRDDSISGFSGWKRMILSYVVGDDG